MITICTHVFEINHLVEIHRKLSKLSSIKAIRTNKKKTFYIEIFVRDINKKCVPYIINVEDIVPMQS